MMSTLPNGGISAHQVGYRDQGKNMTAPTRTIVIAAAIRSAVVSMSSVATGTVAQPSATISPNGRARLNSVDRRQRLRRSTKPGLPGPAEGGCDIVGKGHRVERLWGRPPGARPPRGAPLGRAAAR